MQLPGGSTRIPPARAPATFLVTINGSNIVSTATTNKCNENGGPGTTKNDSLRNLRKDESTGNDPEDVSRFQKRSCHPETTKTSRRNRVTEKHQLLASTPRRKHRGEE
ncbi:uncharacterized protein LOC113464305 [Ceratina calcarata]|uniref:Uncharacterized protein LOC113464305 n=1 Tax=Ceratina calcarata TaxID=156304 RepID=A0AAJ7S1F8_9HYME|nr:uncharacterized protein LOC113464305 [Ceratina calcarata]